MRLPFSVLHYVHVLSTCVYHDIATTDWLADAIVIHFVLSRGIFPPNADSEGVR